MPVTLPTITRNGTSPGALADDYRRALDALRVAFNEVARAYPNARDYCQGSAQPGDLALAEAQHTWRVQSLHTMCTDLETLLSHALDHSPESR